MDHRTYRVKKALILPLGVDLFLLVLLFILSFTKAGSPVESGLFGALTLPVAYFFLESLIRAVTISVEGITRVRLFGSKKINWPSITHAEGLTIKNKAYILLTTTHGLFIVSNIYDRFSSVAKDIASYVEADRTEESFHRLMREAPSGNASVGIAWAAAIVMACIVLLKIYPII